MTISFLSFKQSLLLNKSCVRQAVRLPAVLFFLVLCFSLFGLSLGVRPAQAINSSLATDHTGVAARGAGTTNTITPLASSGSVSSESGVGTDTCLSLLKKAHYAGPSQAMDMDRRYQQPSDAGYAAAVGLVFGLRFTLGPQEVTSVRGQKNRVRLDVWQPRDAMRDTGGARALAVSEYRRCKSEQALQALGDFRFAR